MPPKKQHPSSKLHFTFNDTDEKWLQPMGLLSASMDKTMIIWQPEAEGGMWVEKVSNGAYIH